MPRGGVRHSVTDCLWHRGRSMQRSKVLGETPVVFEDSPNDAHLYIRIRLIDFHERRLNLQSFTEAGIPSVSIETSLSLLLPFIWGLASRIE